MLLSPRKPDSNYKSPAPHQRRESGAELRTVRVVVCGYVLNETMHAFSSFVLTSLIFRQFSVASPLRRRLLLQVNARTHLRTRTHAHLL